MIISAPYYISVPRYSGEGPTGGATVTQRIPEISAKARGEANHLRAVAADEALRLGYPPGSKMPRAIFNEWVLRTTRRFLAEHVRRSPSPEGLLRVGPSRAAAAIDHRVTRAAPGAAPARKSAP